uniref:sigma factor-like helix-turn-helix DNA-binding protein n=1 Tax=Streptomyces odontomachi TaxID=2944940 RepID=UPI0035A8F7D0
MHERHAVRDARRAREFEAFVAGAGGRLLHAATLLTAESLDDNPRARRLLTSALAHTYAAWDGLRGEDPYEHARQSLALRFARGAWRQYHGRSQWYAGWYEVGEALGHVLREALHNVLHRHILQRIHRTPHRPDGDTPLGDSGNGGAPGTGDGSGSSSLTTAFRERLQRSHPKGVLKGLNPQERLILVLRMYEGVAEEQTAALLGLPKERIRAICARAMSTLLHPPPNRTRSLPKVVPS